MSNHFMVVFLSGLLLPASSVDAAEVVWLSDDNSATISGSGTNASGSPAIQPTSGSTREWTVNAGGGNLDAASTTTQVENYWKGAGAAWLRSPYSDVREAFLYAPAAATDRVNCKPSAGSEALFDLGFTSTSFGDGDGGDIGWTTLEFDSVDSRMMVRRSGGAQSDRLRPIAFGTGGAALQDLPTSATTEDIDELTFWIGGNDGEDSDNTVDINVYVGGTSNDHMTTVRVEVDTTGTTPVFTIGDWDGSAYVGTPGTTVALANGASSTVNATISTATATGTWTDCNAFDNMYEVTLDLGATDSFTQFEVQDANDNAKVMGAKVGLTDAAYDDIFPHKPIINSTVLDGSNAVDDPDNALFVIGTPATPLDRMGYVTGFSVNFEWTDEQVVSGTLLEDAPESELNLVLTCSMLDGSGVELSTPTFEDNTDTELDIDLLALTDSVACSSSSAGGSTTYSCGATISLTSLGSALLPGITQGKVCRGDIATAELQWVSNGWGDAITVRGFSLIYDEDQDEDGYTDSGVLTDIQSTTSGFTYNEPLTTVADCAPTDDTAFQTVAAFVDADQDGIGAGVTPANVCVGDGVNDVVFDTVAVVRYSNASTSYSIVGSDCDDTGTNADLVYQNVDLFPDNDDDMVGAGSINSECVGAPMAFTVGGGIAVNAYTNATNDDFSDVGTDCNDTDDSQWVFVTGYADADSDTYTLAGTDVCSNGTLPSGTAENYQTTASPELDCNDTQASVFQVETLFVDSDQDGRGTDAAPASAVCVGAENDSFSSFGTNVSVYTDASGAQYAVTGGDCSDDQSSDPDASTKFQNLTGFPDQDSDGSTLAGVTVCSGLTLPVDSQNYATVASSPLDCDDATGTVYQLKDVYADEDQDGRGSGSLLTDVCVGNATPLNNSFGATVETYTDDIGDFFSTLDGDCLDDAALTNSDLVFQDDVGTPIYRDLDVDGFGEDTEWAPGDYCVGTETSGTFTGFNTSGGSPVETTFRTDNTDCVDDASANADAADINPASTAESALDDAPTDSNCDGFVVCINDADDDGFAPAGVVYDGTPFVTGVNNQVVDDSAGFTDGLRLFGVSAKGTDFTSTCVAEAQAAPAGTLADCDDSSAIAKPGATEIIGNDVDEDCDSNYTCFVDSDEDGFGADTTAVALVAIGETCDDAAEGVAATQGDCVDTNPNIKPTATDEAVVGEVRDFNCDGYVVCFDDADNDNYSPVSDQASAYDGAVLSGLSDGAVFQTSLKAFTVAQGAVSAQTCDDRPNAAPTTTDEDCNDNPALSGAQFNPGVTTTEIIDASASPTMLASRLDFNCDGLVACFLDADSDGFGDDRGAYDGSFNPTVSAFPFVSFIAADSSNQAICPVVEASDCVDDPAVRSDAASVNAGPSQPNSLFNASNGTFTDANCNSQIDCPRDDDGDGAGSSIIESVSLGAFTPPGAANQLCSTLSTPGTYANQAVGTDCNDEEASIRGEISGIGTLTEVADAPSAVEANTPNRNGQSFDEDCDGNIECWEDLDGDGFGYDSLLSGEAKVSVGYVGTGDTVFTEQGLGICKAENGDTTYQGGDCHDSDENAQESNINPNASYCLDTNTYVFSNRTIDPAVSVCPAGSSLIGNNCVDTTTKLVTEATFAACPAGSIEVVEVVNDYDDDCNGESLCWFDSDNDGVASEPVGAELAQAASGGSVSGTTYTAVDVITPRDAGGYSPDRFFCNPENDSDPADPAYTNNGASTFVFTDVLDPDNLNPSRPVTGQIVWDCDDSQSTVYPGANEENDPDADFNCDGSVKCLEDRDGDSFPGSGITVYEIATITTTTPLPLGYNAGGTEACAAITASGGPSFASSANGLDCNDSDQEVFDASGTLIAGVTIGQLANPSGSFTEVVGRAQYQGTPAYYQPNPGDPLEPVIVDEDCDNFFSCYSDRDQDGFGAGVVRIPYEDPDSSIVEGTQPLSCDADPVFSSLGEGVFADCHDNNASAYPVVAADPNLPEYTPPSVPVEIDGDAYDNDCDGNVSCFVDSDGDGFGVQPVPVNVLISSNVVSYQVDQSGGVAASDPQNALLRIDADVEDIFTVAFNQAGANVNGATVPARWDATGTASLASTTAGQIYYACGIEALTSPALIGSGFVTSDINNTNLLSLTYADDGYSAKGGASSSDADFDCDDGSVDAVPGGTSEVPGNDGTGQARDEDCDGFISCYLDADEDGFGTVLLTFQTGLSSDSDAMPSTSLATDGVMASTGTNPNQPVYSCERQSFGGTPYGLASIDGDCHDNNPNAGSNDTEIVGNAFDEDCDGLVSCYQDIDNDSYGTIVQNVSRTGQRVDVDASIAGQELPFNDRTQDALGWYAAPCGDDQFQWGGLALVAAGQNFDADQVSDKGGWDFAVLDAEDQDWDCHDDYAGANPGVANEVIGDPLDNDCDGQVSCYFDRDGDGYGGGDVFTTDTVVALATSSGTNINDSSIIAIPPTLVPQRFDASDFLDVSDNDAEGYQVFPFSLFADLDSSELSSAPTAAVAAPFAKVWYDCRSDGISGEPAAPKLSPSGAGAAGDRGFDCHDSVGEEWLIPTFAERSNALPPTVASLQVLGQTCQGAEVCYAVDAATQTIVEAGATVTLAEAQSDPTLVAGECVQPPVGAGAVVTFEKYCLVPGALDSGVRPLDSSNRDTLLTTNVPLTYQELMIAEAGARAGDIGEVAGNNYDDDCDGFAFCYEDLDGDGIGDTVGQVQPDSGTSGISYSCSSGTTENGWGRANLGGDCNDLDVTLFPVDPNVGSSAISGTDLQLEFDPNDLPDATFNAGAGIHECSGQRALVCVNPVTEDVSKAFGGNCVTGLLNKCLTETVGNAIDESCDGIGLCFTDSDGDGFAESEQSDSVVVRSSELSANGVLCAPDGVVAPNWNIFGPGGGEVNELNTSIQNPPIFANGGWDCDDADASVSPKESEYRNESGELLRTDLRYDSVQFAYPKDYSDSFKNTGNDIDEDCDGEISCFVDVDGDGFGKGIVMDRGSFPHPMGAVILSTDSTDRNPFDNNAVDYDQVGSSYQNPITAASSTQVYSFAAADNPWAVEMDITTVALPTDPTLTVSCSDSGNQRAAVPGDCDDDTFGTNPGAIEADGSGIGDGIDQNCNGEWLCYVDEDGDSFGSKKLVDGVSSAQKYMLAVNQFGPRPISDDFCASVGEANDNEDCLDDIDDVDGSRLVEVINASSVSEVQTVAYFTQPEGGNGYEFYGDEIDGNCDGTEFCFIDRDGDGFVSGPNDQSLTTDDTLVDPIGRTGAVLEFAFGDLVPVYTLTPGEEEGKLIDFCSSVVPGSLVGSDSIEVGLGPWPTSTYDIITVETNLGASFDCDDLDPERNPEAPDVPYSGEDENCDFKNDFDRDGDGYENSEARDLYFLENNLVERSCGSDEFKAEPWLGCENPSAAGVDIIDCDDTEEEVHTAILTGEEETLVTLLRQDWALSLSAEKLVFLSEDEDDEDYYAVDETLSDSGIANRWNAVADKLEEDRECVAGNKVREADGQAPETCRKYLYSAPESCDSGTQIDNDCSAEEQEDKRPGVNTTRTCKLDIRAWAEAQLDIPNGLLMLGDYVECDQGLNEGWYFRVRNDPAGLGTLRLNNCYEDALESYPGYVTGQTPGDLGFRYGPESLGDVIAAVPVRNSSAKFYEEKADSTCGLVASDYSSTAEYQLALERECVEIAGDYYLLYSSLLDLDPLAVRFSVCFDASVSSSSGGDVAALAFSNMTDFLWGVGWTETSVVTDNGFSRAGYEDQDLGVGDGAGVDDRQAGYTCDVQEDDFNWVGNRTDCDDSNPDVNQNAVELCDGQDNNCNSVIDEPDVDLAFTEDFDAVGSGGRWYARDDDGDGYGIILDGEMKTSRELILADRDAIYYCTNYLECDEDADEECTGRCGSNNEGFEEGEKCFYEEGVFSDCADNDEGVYPREANHPVLESPIQRYDGKDNNCDKSIPLYELDCDGDDSFSYPHPLAGAGVGVFSDKFEYNPLDLPISGFRNYLNTEFATPADIGLVDCEDLGTGPTFSCFGTNLTAICDANGFWAVKYDDLVGETDRFRGYNLLPAGNQGYNTDGFDCDDQDALRFTQKSADTVGREFCDGLDNDCNAFYELIGEDANGIPDVMEDRAAFGYVGPSEADADNDGSMICIDENTVESSATAQDLFVADRGGTSALSQENGGDCLDSCSLANPIGGIEEVCNGFSKQDTCSTDPDAQLEFLADPDDDNYRTCGAWGFPEAELKQEKIYTLVYTEKVEVADENDSILYEMTPLIPPRRYREAVWQDRLLNPADPSGENSEESESGQDEGDSLYGQFRECDLGLVESLEELMGPMPVGLADDTTLVDPDGTETVEKMLDFCVRLETCRVALDQFNSGGGQTETNRNDDDVIDRSPLPPVSGNVAIPEYCKDLYEENSAGVPEVMGSCDFVELQISEDDGGLAGDSALYSKAQFDGTVNDRACLYTEDGVNLYHPEQAITRTVWSREQIVLARKLAVEFDCFRTQGTFGCADNLTADSSYVHSSDYFLEDWNSPYKDVLKTNGQYFAMGSRQFSDAAEDPLDDDRWWLYIGRYNVRRQLDSEVVYGCWGEPSRTSAGELFAQSLEIVGGDCENSITGDAKDPAAANRGAAEGPGDLVGRYAGTLGSCEACYDKIDNNCDGTVDFDDPTCAVCDLGQQGPTCSGCAADGANTTRSLPVLLLIGLLGLSRRRREEDAA